MRLISLSASHESFRPIYFNKTGLSLILGKQKNPEISDTKKTYNGVGKSLAIILVHFCLGSSKNIHLEKSLSNWEFSLKFELKGKEYESVRNTSSQNKIFLNGEELSISEFCSKLESLTLLIPYKADGLTFRSLLPRFIRPRKESFVSFDAIYSNEQPYNKLLCNAFLLGLQIDLVTTKYELKSERDRIRDLRTSLSKDSIFLEFFTENQNIDIALKDLEEKIVYVSKNLKSFQIAENYYEVQKQADLTGKKLQELKNKAVLLTNSIENINRSLEVTPDISPNKLLNLYEEIRYKLSDSIVKDIKEIAAFHNKLLANRFKRLSLDKSRFEQELSSLKKNISNTAKTLDSQIQFLGAHGALDELVKLSNYLSSLQAKAQKIRDYRGLLDKYSDETQEIQIALSNETKRANSYLKQAKPLLDENLERFRLFSSSFYPDKPGGLTVANNEGDNRIRFDISAKIQDDASDGINEVKIFCYDMTILMGQHNHLIDFLFHDSRLFSDIDPRQRATLFRIAYENTLNVEKQYIATVNEDQLLAMKELFSEEDFTKIIKDNIVLELMDDSAESKLLGIQVDMNY